MGEIVSSMFGPTPMEIQQAQRQAAEQKAYRDSQMSRMQQSDYLMNRAGATFGGMLGDALGIQNPELAKAQQQQELNKQIDLSTPESIRASAKMLLDKGFRNEAAGLLKMAQDMEYKKALTTKALTAGSKDYEYEKMMEILNDPESSEEMKTMAKNRIAALNAKASGAGGKPSSQFKTGEDGFVYEMIKGTDGTSMTRQVMKPDGTPLRAAEASPELKAKMNQAGAGATAVGKAAGEAQQAAVDAESVAETANRQLDELLNHEGFASAVGIGMPYASKFTGAKEMAFKKRLDQIKGGAFLQAFNMLRGGGQITEVEGQKATDAMNRMDMATSEKEFREAADDYRMALKTGIEKLKKKGSLAYQLPEQQGTVNTPETVAKSNVPKFSGVTSPFQVRAMYKAGKMSKQDANMVLDDMKARGLF